MLTLLVMVLAASSFAFAQAKNTKKKKTKPKSTQDKAVLDRKKKDLQADIDLTDNLLKQTRRSKTLSLSQLVALNKKIEAREALIGEINNEIVTLDALIADNNTMVTQLDTEIAQLKRDYAKMIVFAYRNRDSYQRMMFIFSSDNFNQAFLRMRYMQQISESRKEQAEKITDRQQELNENIRELEAQKAEKKLLLGSEETEKGQLAVEKEDKDKTFHELTDKENELKKELDKKKAEKASIDKAIQDIIVATTIPSNPKPNTGNTGTKPNNPNNANSGVTAKTGSNAKTNPPATGNPPANNTASNPPVDPDPTISDGFAGNQGKLPWPVSEGTITSHFGKQPHPVLKDVYINNNGIDIATPPDASARAVFDGEVTGITNIPGSGWLVIVRHGEYLTVYAKLEEVFVKKGDKVKAKQNIGKIANDDDEGHSVLHFEVWKSGVGKMDPELWLMSRKG